MTIREHVILYSGVLLVLAGVAGSRPAIAQEPECQPYDVAIENLAKNGWIVHPDIVIGDEYEADRLLVGSFKGFAFAMPMIGGCVIPVTPIPLGAVKDKGTPA